MPTLIKVPPEGMHILFAQHVPDYELINGQLVLACSVMSLHTSNIKTKAVNCKATVFSSLLKTNVVWNF